MSIRRRYGDCQRADGNCSICSLVHYGRDCHNRALPPLMWARMAAIMSQPELSEKSGVSLRQIQKIESGEIDAGNITARNLLALAEALEINPKYLI